AVGARLTGLSRRRGIAKCRRCVARRRTALRRHLRVWYPRVAPCVQPSINAVLSAFVHDHVQRERKPVAERNSNLSRTGLESLYSPRRSRWLYQDRRFIVRRPTIGQGACECIPFIVKRHDRKRSPLTATQYQCVDTLAEGVLHLDGGDLDPAQVGEVVDLSVSNR